MIIETCPKCGGELVDLALNTYQPLPQKACTSCGWTGTIEKIECVPFPFEGTKTRMNYSALLLSAPTDTDWLECKRRALITIGKQAVNPPSSEWKYAILEARHSPIRYLRYSFFIECPYWVSVHLCRHVHAQPYVKSQRNDRQDEYDRNDAPQSAPVSMILDVNAEELQVIANKRLCLKASQETRQIVQAMCKLAEDATPELNGLLVPMCEYHGGVCHEMNPCGKAKKLYTEAEILEMVKRIFG